MVGDKIIATVDKLFLAPRLIWRALFRLGYLFFIAGRLMFRRELSSPEKLRFFLEQSDGALLKFGQILALRADILPLAYTTELFKLLASISPRPWSIMRKVLEEELGQGVEEIFSQLEDVPLASASISQVYRGVLKSGEKVVVKIRRPGVAEAFETDFLLVATLAGLIDLFRFFGSIEFMELVNEFIVWTRRELDFRFEANNAEIFFRNSPQERPIIVPKIFRDYCTEKIMVSEYLEQVVRLDQIMELLQSGKWQAEDFYRRGLELPEIAESLAIDILRQYFVDGIFHADPHPANVFVVPGGRLGYFDFGIVGEAGDRRLDIAKIFWCLAQKDYLGMSQSFLAFVRGMMRPELAVLERQQAERFVHYREVLDKVEQKIVLEFASDLEKILAPWYEGALSDDGDSRTAIVFGDLLRRAEQYHLFLPRELIVCFRTMIIVEMVALQLDNRFDMVKVLKLFFNLWSVADLEKRIVSPASLWLPDVPVADLKYGDLLELRAYERENMMGMMERFLEIIAYYSETDPEIRLLLKKTKTQNNVNA